VLPWPSRQLLSRPGFRPARLSLLTRLSEAAFTYWRASERAGHPAAVRAEIFSSPFLLSISMALTWHNSSILQASSVSETPHSEKQWLGRVQLGGKNNMLECYGGMR